MAPPRKVKKSKSKKRRVTKKPRINNVNKINISVGGASGGGGGGGAGGGSGSASVYQPQPQPQMARELFPRTEVKGSYPPQYIKPGWDHLPATDDAMSGFKSTYHHPPSLVATATKDDDLASAISRGKSRATMSLADDDTISLHSIKPEPVAVKLEPDPFGHQIKVDRSLVDLTIPTPSLPFADNTASDDNNLMAVVPYGFEPKKVSRRVKSEFRMAKGIRNSRIDLTDDGIEVQDIPPEPRFVQDLLFEEDNPADYNSSRFAPAPETIHTVLGFGDPTSSDHQKQSADLLPEQGNVAQRVATIENRIIVPEKAKRIPTQRARISRGYDDAPKVDREILEQVGDRRMKFGGVDPFQDDTPVLKAMKQADNNEIYRILPPGSW